MFGALALRSDEGLMLKHQLFYPLWWLIYIFNSVVNTKLPAILSDRRSTTVSLETYSFLQFVVAFTFLCPMTILISSIISPIFKSIFL